MGGLLESATECSVWCFVGSCLATKILKAHISKLKW